MDVDEQVELVRHNAWGMDRIAWEGDDADAAPIDLEDPLAEPLEDPRY